LWTPAGRGSALRETLCRVSDGDVAANLACCGPVAANRQGERFGALVGGFRGRSCPHGARPDAAGRAAATTAVCRWSSRIHGPSELADGTGVSVPCD
jgi:hypothetical protein